MPSASVQTGCSNALCSSDGELAPACFIERRGKAKQCVPGRCGPWVVILPEDAPFHLRDISAAGGLISVFCSLGELWRLCRYLMETHRIVEWFGFKETLKIVWFQPPAVVGTPSTRPVAQSPIQPDPAHF